MSLLDVCQGSSSYRIKRENRMTVDRQFHPMGCPRMTNLVTIAIVLLVCSTSRSQINRANDPWRSIERKAQAAGAADNAIREMFRIVSSGMSTEKDDEKLVNLIKEEIVRTMESIKSSTVSIEVTAKRAQKLVAEFTMAYTNAIYKSQTREEAKLNFARFQNTVQKIVDIIKHEKFFV